VEQSDSRTQAILSWQRTPTIDLRVEQDEQQRYLILNGQRQSQMKLRQTSDPSYPHLLLLLDWLADKPWHRLLQLGLGGGELSRVLAAHWPDRQVVSVEQEPLIIEAFLQFFQPQPHPNETIICADAASFAISAAAQQQQFDVIFVDIFPWPENWQQLLKALLKLRAQPGFICINLPYATKPEQWQQFWQKTQVELQCFNVAGYQNQLWLGA
jgi:spermidine synthase